MIKALEVQRRHSPGQCDSSYRNICDGVAEWVEDPYLAEIEDIHDKRWMCQGMMQEAADDI